MKAELKRMAAMVAVAIAALAFSAVPARADVVATAACPANVLCVYEDTGFNNVLPFEDWNFTPQGCVWSLVPYNFPGSRHPANDRISSVINNLGVAVNLFQDINHGGQFVHIGAHSSDENLATGLMPIYNNQGAVITFGTFNDVTSSICS